MANAPVGRVLLISKGSYSASATYKMLDWVRHDGKAWVCKQESIGNVPQDGSYWQLLAQDGAEGGYCYIRYSANADGTGFVAIPTVATKYIGFYTGNSDVAPTDKTEYTWSKFMGEDGRGISSIAKTGTSGLVDTYTITYSDNTTSTFSVTNGKDGNLNYYGTLITGNSTTPTIYPTGITMARVNDSYTNTTTFFEYRCTVAGNATTAKWVYVGSKKGADGLGSGDMLKATYDVNNNGIVDNAEKLGGELPSYYLYTLPKGGDNLGGVKNGGNVTINEDGEMNADVGAGTWSALNEKPFSSVGTSGLKVASNTLDVDFTKVQSILADATTSASGKMSAADKTKLNGIATGANNYSLPTASDTVKGGIKIGAGLTVNESGTLGVAEEILDSGTAIKNNTTANQYAGALGAKDLFSELDSKLENTIYEEFSFTETIAGGTDLRKRYTPPSKTGYTLTGCYVKSCNVGTDAICTAILLRDTKQIAFAFYHNSASGTYNYTFYVNLEYKKSIE